MKIDDISISDLKIDKLCLTRLQQRDIPQHLLHVDLIAKIFLAAMLFSNQFYALKKILQMWPIR